MPTPKITPTAAVLTVSHHAKFSIFFPCEYAVGISTLYCVLKKMSTNAPKLVCAFEFNSRDVMRHKYFINKQNVITLSVHKTVMDIISTTRIFNNKYSKVPQTLTKDLFASSEGKLLLEQKVTQFRCKVLVDILEPTPCYVIFALESVLC